MTQPAVTKPRPAITKPQLHPREVGDNELKTFDWLRRSHRGPGYVSYSSLSDRPACAFEFGADGYAGSCNYGGELLHMAAPSPNTGIIFCRGHFERSMYASIARSQQVIGRLSTFGLKLSNAKAAGLPINTEGLRLGKILDRGSFNHRWPFVEYSLLLDSTASGDGSPNAQKHDKVEGQLETGTCTMLSFVKDHMLYQVLRIEQGCWANSRSSICRPFPEDGKIILQIGGPVRFETFEANKDIHLETAVYSTDGTYATRETLHKGPVGRPESPEPRVVRRWTGESTNTDVSWKSQNEHLTQPFYAKCEVPKRVADKQGATFIAAFRLTDLDPSSSSNDCWDKVPTSEEIYRYVNGIPEPSQTSGPPPPRDAPLPMWESIFVNHELPRRSVQPKKVPFALSEVDLVSRCLEKTLQVGFIPVGTPHRTPRNGEPPEEVQPLALVSNLFISPNVDLKALFWKVRFLAKVHQFLSLFLKDEALDIETRSTAEGQLLRIQRHVKGVVRYLVDALLRSPENGSDPGPPENGSNPCPQLIMPDNNIFAESNYYYVLITIWYAVHAMPKANWDFSGLDISDKAELLNPSRLPRDDCKFEWASADKVSLLQLYHYKSLLELSKKYPDTWGGSSLGVDISILEEQVRRLDKAAQIQSAAKLASTVPYSASDEIFDRLAFLAPELQLYNSIPSLSVDRIRNRDFTRQIDPGKPVDDDSSASTSGPWELQMLCHHSRLKVLSFRAEHITHGNGVMDEWMLKKANECKSRLLLFLDAEGALISSWDREDHKARRGILRSEATAVVASTLLDLQSIPLRDRDCQDVRAESVSAIQHESPTQKHPIWDFRAVSQELQEVKDVACRQLESLEKLARTPEGDTLPIIPWKGFAPPRIYHPDGFINSPDDTPELYEHHGLRNTVLPGTLGNYIDLPEAGFADARVIKKLRLDSILIHDIVPDRNPNARSSFKVRSNLERPHYALNNGELDDNITAAKLYDSLVDQEVRHRFLTVRIDSRDIMGLVVYVSHPESAACLNSHLLKFPRFDCLNGDMWKARITLRSWQWPEGQIRRRSRAPVKSAPVEPLPCTGEYTYDESICLPDHLKAGLHAHQPEFNVNYQLKVSSFVLSTTLLGDFSKCTIFSDLIPEQEAEQLAKDSAEIWEIFVHQPQTARCLVFLLVLAKLCQEIASDCETAIYHFQGMIKFRDVMAGHRRPKDESAATKFKLGLWSVTSLNKIQSSLQESLNCIQEAKDVLTAQIKDGPGTRSQALEGMCQKYLSRFEGSLLQLKSVHARVCGSKELSDWTKDSFSSVLSLDYSDSADQQNRTIQKLTYLTIGYLPLGLIAAIFAVPKEQEIVSVPTGLPWFIGSIIIMLVTTIVVAIFIGKIIDFFAWPTDEQWDPYRVPTLSVKVSRGRGRGGVVLIESEKYRHSRNLWLWLVSKIHPYWVPPFLRFQMEGEEESA
ncbi:hypothetical protein MAPG_00027 [Magnaporthiopsis poae ATCC 64411]|uniref:Uncharacterized protein n=1 Tax=Magnaporthiopsis poae (strain ATCC 64411 / 73-15) TaxID=644358 RepID=A0A0C4DJW8_MAGP6|nr:hypothetical protein MAPG_00027 [Magnaporthiopsis poae ATCC 64411]